MTTLIKPSDGRMCLNSDMALPFGLRMGEVFVKLPNALLLKVTALWHESTNASLPWPNGVGHDNDAW